MTIVRRLIEEERKFHIDNLINNILPKGMFELVSDDTIRYNGGADKWKEEFVATLQEKAKAVTTENCTLWIGEVYQLEKYLKNPLDTGYQLYGRAVYQRSCRTILRVSASGKPISAWNIAVYQWSD